MKSAVLILVVGWAAVAVGQACVFPNLCGSTSLSPIVYPSTPPNVGTLTGSGTIVTDTTFVPAGIKIIRVTDSTYDPNSIGANSNTYAASLGGSDDEDAWSLDDKLFYVCSSGAVCYLNSFNPTTLALGRPYSALTSGCPSPRTNCSTYGGWSITGSIFFSKSDNCKLYQWSGTAFKSYVFGSDVSPLNSCSNSISGPPTATTVFDFIEDSPTGCVGTACNCLPSDFGSPTWTGNGAASQGDASFAAGFSSVAYNDGTGTGQDHGIYAVEYVPGKGCISYNTATGSIHADPGFSGGAGLTCSATQCTGTSTSPSTFRIHSVRQGWDGTRFYLNPLAAITGPNFPSDSIVWPRGTTYGYWSEAGHNGSGHGCFGALGMWNAPGQPLNGWYYRTNPISSGPSGTEVLITTVPSPNTQQFDTHCGPQMTNASDTNPIGFQSTTNSQSANGCCLLPFDNSNNGYITIPWVSELDFMTNDGSGRVFRMALTYNSGFGVDFAAQNTITNCSADGRYCLWGSDWLNTLGNVGGDSTTCVPGGPAWKASKAYPANYTINPTHNNAGDYVFKATTPGTSGGTEPGAWPQIVGNTQTDGGAVWTNLGTNKGTAACRTDAFLAVMSNPIGTPNLRTIMLAQRK